MTTTQYTAEQRAQIAEAFRAAKKHLRDPSSSRVEQSRFICLAISCAAMAGEISQAAERAAVAVIEGRLINPDTGCRYHSALTWLKNHAGVPARSITDRRLQAWRHAWLDSLIKEFSA